MPKKKPVRKKSNKKFAVEAPKVFTFKTKYRGRIILGIIMILVLLFLGVRQIQIFQEKADYRQAEVVLDRLYGEIEAKIGKPDKIERGEECFYSSAKFSKGILRCSVSVYFSQSIDDVGLASTNANQIVNILKQDTRLKISEYKYSDLIDFSTKEDYSRLGESSRDFELIGNSRRCFVSFQYLNPKDALEFKRIVANNSSNKLIMDISCGGKAKTEHFPVRAP